MSQKRTQDDSSSSCNLEDTTHSPDDKRAKRLPSFRSVVLEVMKQKSFQNALEPMLRRVVKEEVESAIRKHAINLKRNWDDDMIPCESRNLQLKFLSTLSLPVFTGTRIEGEDGSAIKVALIDAAFDEVVLDSPESSAKVEIVVLEGDFDGDEGENWTLEEFKNNIVREREGKKPLLTGDVNIYLKEGIGSVGELSFTDNSSWTRSRRFRLGARVVGNSDGARIREAKTESFIVRDHRGELYKKHHPPALSDEVWRLEKIGKDGAFHKRLSIERVRTVKDFLILLHLDPARLRNWQPVLEILPVGQNFTEILSSSDHGRKILGSGMSAKMWEVTIEHARTCVLDKRVYLYYSPISQHRNGVVFNAVGQVMGLYSDSQSVPFEQLSDNEKLDAQRMVTEAYQHWDGVISFEDMNTLIGMPSQPSSSPSTETSDASKLLTSQRINRIDYAQPSTSSHDSFSPLYSLGCLGSPDDFSLQALDALDLRFDHGIDFPVHVTNPMFCSSNSVSRTFHDDEQLRFMDIDCPSTTNMNLGSQSELQSAYSGFMKPHLPGRAVKGQACRRWRVLSSILRWFQVRRLVVMRKTLCPRIQRC